MNQYQTLDYLLLGYFLLLFIITSATALVSLFEGERRAAMRALAGSILVSAPFLFLLFTSFPARDLLSWSALIGTGIVALLLVLPLPSPFPKLISQPAFQIDERDTMFSRNELIPGSPEFLSYYTEKPDKKSIDDFFREKPGLLSPNARFYHPFFFNATKSSFSTIEGLHGKIKPAPSVERQTVEPFELVRFIKSWMRHSGAHSVGVTALRPYHFYSHSGRGKRYGKPVDCDHISAIALSVEMDNRMVACGPDAPTILESSDQYLQAALMAVKLAGFLAELGYSSRAHIDADYLVVCPLVARDAGLGEIGRMGLLMTPKLGPRVRLAVVTTELVLPTDDVRPDHSMTEFCRFCKKCAVVCPSQAIPRTEMSVDGNGITRWQIDQERCFSYWCLTGTDCGRCIALCPYSHPSNLLHNSVRFLIRHAFFFRRFAAFFDDLLYGKKPPPHFDCGWKLKQQGEPR